MTQLDGVCHWRSHSHLLERGLLGASSSTLLDNPISLNVSQPFVSSFGNALLSLDPTFKLCLFFHDVWCLRSLCLSDANPVLDVQSVKNFSRCVACHFALMMDSFAVANPFCFVRSR